VLSVDFPSLFGESSGYPLSNIWLLDLWCPKTLSPWMIVCHTCTNIWMVSSWWTYAMSCYSSYLPGGATLPTCIVDPHIVPWVPFHPFIDYLGLFIDLWMVVGTCSQICAHYPKQLLQECVHESTIPVSDYLSR
jgi:hypothetical protein